VGCYRPPGRKPKRGRTGRVRWCTLWVSRTHLPQQTVGMKQCLLRVWYVTPNDHGAVCQRVRRDWSCFFRLGSLVGALKVGGSASLNGEDVVFPLDKDECH
jgi:hypothetical protein